MQAKTFANLSIGLFFLVSSISLATLMTMFVFVWQPIWTEGFKDFHTISDAIGKLNEIIRMRKSMIHMEGTMEAMTEIRSIMTGMSESMKKLEEINPNIIRINHSVDLMGRTMSGQLGIMNHEVNQMSDRFSPMGMMPFNW